MSTGGRKDKPSPPPPEETHSGDRLLTSEDLFGDIVDAPSAPRSTAAPVRKGAIRVQVSEPGRSAEKSGRHENEVLPEDVAALLDAFSEPAEAAERAAASSVPPPAPVSSRAPERPEAAGRQASPSAEGLLDGLVPPHAAAPAAPVPPPARDGARARTQPRTPGRTKPSRPGPAAPPRPGPASAPPAHARAAPPAESLLDLPEFREVARPPAPAAAPIRFQASPPDVAPAAERVALDLAALAEDAFRDAAPPARPPTQPRGSGQTYGPYRLLEKVAVGGMAEVFRAKRSGVDGFEKVLAVKRILAHLSDNKEFVDMFVDEAKMVAGLTHPNIVQIYDLGRIDRTHYIAMEYVHGRDLRTILRRVKERGIRIPLDLSALIVGRVCAALEYAHRKRDEGGRAMKIVHRDVSPQNILISFEGDVKLTDFGIAKAATRATNTERGALRGKLLYMSPEQAWGKPMDKRSDIFSLGIVLYEMLTDQKPFMGTTEMSILETVRECRVTPPTTLNPRIPERLEKALVKALERDPDVRYQDAGEMGRDLERALADRKAPTSVELARLMEVLFDVEERGDVHDEIAAADYRSGSAKIEIELDGGAPAEGSPGTEATAARDMSLDKLLKRFGIK